MLRELPGVKEAMKTSVYTYSIQCADINLCKVCERKLRKEVLEQARVEEEVRDLIKQITNSQWLI